MLHFENDYNKGIHPQLLQALVDSNQESTFLTQLNMARSTPKKN